MYRKGQFYVVLVEMLIGGASMENTMEVPQKIKSRTMIYHPAILFLVYFIPKGMKAGTPTGICTSMFTAALFPAVKRKQYTCPLSDNG